MNRQDAKLFLRALGSQRTTDSGEWLQTSCVLAPWKHQSGRDAHPSAGIRIDPKGESFYSCFTCGGQDLIGLVYELRRLGASDQFDLKTAMELATRDGEETKVSVNIKEWGESKTPAEVTFPETWLKSFMRATSSTAALDYLATREIDEATVTALDLRYDHRLNAICFPIRNFGGQLCGLRARRMTPQNDEPRYHVYRTGTGLHNPVVWYGEHLLDFDKPVVMVESVFDLASVYRVYPNVCAPMSANVSEDRAKRLSGAIEILTFFDGDAAGDRARNKVDKLFKHSYVAHTYPKEGCKDPGEMTVDEITDVLSPYIRLHKGSTHERHSHDGPVLL